MSKLTINADIIERLINKHGEIGTCGNKNCEVCETIRKIRCDLGPGERRGKKAGNKDKAKFRYTVKKGGSCKTFYKVLDIAIFLNVSESYVSRMITNNKEVKGCLVTKTKIELGEI